MNSELPSMIDSFPNDELVSPFPMQKQFFITTNPGEAIHDHYDLANAKVVGEGSYGKVVKALRKNKIQLRAIKIISKTRVSDPEKFRTEIEILKDLDHPNVIKLYEIYEDPENIYLVMELCQGGELLDRMRDRENEYFTEDEARIVFQQIISAINYCHAKKICHRDLKPENFLYSTTEENSPIKIIDFGLSKIFKAEKSECKANNMKSFSGTIAFLAPEIISGSYDEKVDIWSAGVILYFMLCGYLPFMGDGPEVLLAIKHLDYNFYGPEFKKVSNECKNLIRSILTSAEKRITLEAILNDPWLYPNKMNGLIKKTPLNLHLNIGHRISKFKNYGKLKKSLLCYIASQLSEQEIGELREIFLVLADKDGRITYDQFEKAFENTKFMHKDKDSLKNVFEGIDVNKKGVIDYTEFLAAAIPEEIYLKEDKINSAFLVFDRDKTGKVSKTELKKTLGQHSYYESKEDTYWEKIMEDSDHNKDGYLDHDDFKKVLEKD